MSTKLLFLCLFFISKIAHISAQTYYPDVYDFPETGFYKVRAENGYILGYVTQNNDTNNWVLASRFLRSKAPNIDFNDKDIFAEWVNNAWVERTTFLDSFIMENGTIKELYKRNKYNYPGYVRDLLYRYVFSYNSNNRMVSYNLFISQNGKPSNLSLYSKTFITYDTNNSRKKDSIVYSSTASQTILVYYTYDNQGNPIFEVGIIGGDTVYKTSTTYQNNKITTNNRWDFNSTSDEWSLNNSDTFTYNSKELLSKNISYGRYFLDGQFVFSKFNTIHYDYNNNNKLTEMRLFDEYIGESNNAIKYVFYYSPENKAYLGYEYSGDSLGNWSPKASGKYLFDFLSSTSIVTSNSTQSSLFPNPANDYLNLAGLDAINSIELIDIQGKTLVLPVISNQIDLSNIESGMYFAIIRQDEQIVHSQKLLIKHN